MKNLSVRTAGRIIFGALMAVVIALLTTSIGSAFLHSIPSKQEATPTSIPCYGAGFLDQTFDPPNTVMTPGSSFSTTWFIVNRGSCTWTPEYAWVFSDGVRMEGDTVSLSDEIQPGGSIGVTLNLVAPQSEGIHIGYWHLQDPNGTQFGGGPEARSMFFVAIFVSSNPDAEMPITVDEIPRLELDIDPNRTPESPTETPSATQSDPTSTATHTIAPLPEPTNTPTSVRDIHSSGDPGPSFLPLTLFDDEYFNIRYREAGPYVPQFTTSIPTPLDISLEPEVIGTNVLLAALLMIPFALANEGFNRMLEERWNRRTGKRPPPIWFRKVQKWFIILPADSPKGRLTFRVGLRVLILTLVYGLLFSLLDSTWKPFSKEGTLLFISMAITYGVVGMIDDFLQWRKLRKWKLPVRTTLSSSNLLMALASISISRFLYLIPGLMFGTPELLRIDEGEIPPKKQRKLLGISVLTFTTIGLAAWFLTLCTRQILGTSIENPVASSAIVGFLEALLLITFAVVIENFFVQLLGFQGTFGQILKQYNRPLWLAALIAVTFIFIHTLINPRSGLTNALQKGNVIVFIGVVVSFIIGVLIAQLVQWIRRRNKNPSTN